MWLNFPLSPYPHALLRLSHKGRGESERRIFGTGGEGSQKEGIRHKGMEINKKSSSPSPLVVELGLGDEGDLVTPLQPINYRLSTIRLAGKDCFKRSPYKAKALPPNNNPKCSRSYSATLAASFTQSLSTPSQCP